MVEEKKKYRCRVHEYVSSRLVNEEPEDVIIEGYEPPKLNLLTYMGLKDGNTWFREIISCEEIGEELEELEEYCKKVMLGIDNNFTKECVDRIIASFNSDKDELVKEPPIRTYKTPDDCKNEKVNAINLAATKRGTLMSVLSSVAKKRIIKSSDNFRLQVSTVLMEKVIEEVNENLPFEKQFKKHPRTDEIIIVLHDKEWKIKNRWYRDDTSDRDIEEMLLNTLGTVS